jgi:tetratricopeptide (TPR) repeat protein
VALAVPYSPAFAQAAQGGQKNWKDRAEYDLYEAISKPDTAPAKRLDLLNQWKEKYPSSDFADVRQGVYMTTYAQLGRPGDAITAAGEVLGKDPNNLQALSTALTSVFSLQNGTPDQLATSEKAAQQVASNVDALFGSDKKPANVGDADWQAAKKNMNVLAQNALGFVAWQRKDFEKAEGEFTKSLKLEPNQGQVSYWMSVVMLAQKKPEKYSNALWHYARAASYDGPGSLNAQGRAQVLQTFKTTYNTYHGSAEGMDKVLADAKAAALPPDGWKIPSKVDIAKGQIEKEEELKKANPSLALWKSIKEALTGAEAQAYFNEHMKEAELPMEFKGKLIEARPETNPKELVIAVEDGLTPDATLVLDAPLRGKMDPGSDIGFNKGVAQKYQTSPYMVTFNVEKANLTGWKGAPAPAAPKAKPRPPVRKK